MKILVNEKDAKCSVCSMKTNLAVNTETNRVWCKFCGSDALLDVNGGEFVPKFKMDSRNSSRCWPGFARREEDL